MPSSSSRAFQRTLVRSDWPGTSSRGSSLHQLPSNCTSLASNCTSLASNCTSLHSNCTSSLQIANRIAPACTTLDGTDRRHAPTSLIEMPLRPFGRAASSFGIFSLQNPPIFAVHGQHRLINQLPYLGDQIRSSQYRFVGQPLTHGIWRVFFPTGYEHS